MYREHPDDPRSQALIAARLNNDIEAAWLIEQATRVKNGWTNTVWEIILPNKTTMFWSSSTYRFYEKDVVKGTIAGLIRMLMKHTPNP